jgi:hypothetical protein
MSAQEEHMPNNDLADRSGATSTQAALLLALVLAAVAALAAGTSQARTSHTHAVQVHVAIVAKGDIGQYAGMCGSLGGTDSLDGALDLEDLGDDGTARYKGDLTRMTEVNACGTKPAPTEDQVAMCSAHLSGRSVMEVTLEVYEDDRGAWVKSKPVPTPMPATRKQIGGCTEPGEWLDAYPDDGWMSGLGFETVPSGPLIPGTYQTDNLTLTVY